MNHPTNNSIKDPINPMVRLNATGAVDLQQRATADGTNLRPNTHYWRPGDIVFRRGTELDIANALFVVQSPVSPPPGQVGVIFFCPYYQRVDVLTGQLIDPRIVRFMPIAELYHYSEFGLQLMDATFDPYLQWREKKALSSAEEPPGGGHATFPATSPATSATPSPANPDNTEDSTDDSGDI